MHFFSEARASRDRTRHRDSSYQAIEGASCPPSPATAQMQHRVQGAYEASVEQMSFVHLFWADIAISSSAPISAASLLIFLRCRKSDNFLLVLSLAISRHLTWRPSSSHQVNSPG